MSESVPPAVPPKTGWRSWIDIGPALIVACVVLGPGSILTSSKVGTQFGYNMLWVILIATFFMICATALASRVGLAYQKSLCDELTDRLGRGVAIATGIVMFLVVTSFQASNNFAILAAVEPFGADTIPDWVWLVGMNLLVITALYGFRQLYTPIEWLMKGLMGLMLLVFLINVFAAVPSLSGIFSGLVPWLPEDAAFFAHTEDQIKDGKVATAVIDPLWAVQGMIATTFSLAGAFYQAYLVRDKGWTQHDLQKGTRDSVIGISMLGFATCVVMITAAATLHGRVPVGELKTTTDVANQLRPFFGSAAVWLFALGIFAGAFSSFLVNAMVGGVLLSDGFGKGHKMEQKGPRLATVGALGVAMVIALIAGDKARITDLIVFAQALTVVGVPFLGVVLLYLATRTEAGNMPRFLIISVSLGVLLAAMLAVRTGWTLYLKLT